MTHTYLLLKRIILVQVAVLFCSGIVTSQNSIITQTFGYTGSAQTFTVPACVLTLTLNVSGAQGASNANSIAGGQGGFVSGILTVTPGDVLTIFTGGMNGYNGGGLAGLSSCSLAIGGNGGGASDIRRNGILLSNRIVVAGGGGGAGGNRVSGCGRGTGGGGGGGFHGGGGGAGFPQASVILPGGGNQICGGNGGISTFLYTQNGTAGILGTGGNGGNETSSMQNGNNAALTGGHGGGLSGANGQQPASNLFTGQSGAGGSSYQGNLANASTTAGNRTGDGEVTISYSTAQPVVVYTSANSICLNAIVYLSTGSLLNYNWNTGAQTPSVAVAPTSNSTYFVNGVNAANCPVYGAITITVNSAPPVVSVVNSSLVICPGNTVSLMASGAVSYSWSNNVSNGVAFTPTAASQYTVTGFNGCGMTTATTSVGFSPLPVTIAATSTLICAGHSAVLAGAGATTYTWFPTLQSSSSLYVTPAANTTYTLKGKTGHCIATATVVVMVSPNPVITVSASNSIICSGDATSLFAGGASSYSWSSGGMGNSSIVVSPTTTTFYSVTGTNSLNCSSMATQVVVVKARPALVASVLDSVVCIGNPARLVATGANFYSWSDGTVSYSTTVNPLTTSNYTVTGTNANGCSKTQTLTVSVFMPTISVTNNTAVCMGGNVLIGADGADTYTWSPNLSLQYISVSPTVSTIYTVNATAISDGGLGCNSTNTVLVTVNSNPVITTSSTHATICHGQTSTISASGAVTYTWNNGTNTQDITVTPPMSQSYTYTVTGTDANGCSNTASFLLKVSSCVGIKNYSAANELVIYPNPNNGEFTISAEQPMELAVINETGQQVKNIVLNENNKDVNISDLSNGIYFITGKNDNGFVKKKIIIAR